jgi:hypothetical protein
MYYIFTILLFIIFYYVFVKLLSSVIKGCLTAVLVVFIIMALVIMIRSAESPIDLFGIFRIHNFKVIRI